MSSSELWLLEARAIKALARIRVYVEAVDAWEPEYPDSAPARRHQAQADAWRPLVSNE